MTDPEAVALDLEAVLAGALNEEGFRRKCASQVASPALDAIWDNLEHYLADADIRAKDGAYRDMQEGELRKLIQLLRQGASINQLRRVTFLSVT